MILGVDGVGDLVSLILGGEGVGANLLGDGGPAKEEDTLECSSLMALWASRSPA